MGRGFLSGLTSGGVFGAIVLMLLSLYAPLPQNRTSELSEAVEAVTEEVAPAEEAPQPDADPAPETSSSAEDASAPEAEPASGEQSATEATTSEPSTQPETAETADEPAAPTQDEDTSATDTDPVGESGDASGAIVDEAPGIASQIGALIPEPETSQPEVEAEPVLETATSAFDTNGRSPDLLIISKEAPVLDLPDVVSFEPEAAQNETVAIDAQAIRQLRPTAPAPQRQTVLLETDADGQPTVTLVPREDVSEPPVVQSNLPSVSDEIDKILSAEQPDALGTPSGLAPRPRVDLTGLISPGGERLADAGVSSRLPQTTDEAGAGGTIFDGSNRTGSTIRTVSERQTAEADPAPEPAPLDPDEVGALRAFAVDPQSPPSAAPRFAVALIDAGDLGVPRSELISLGLTVSIALDPISADATEAMSAYRRGGFEVLALPNDLPRNAAASDVAVAVSGYFDILSQSIGLLEPLDRRIQSNRGLLGPVIDSLKPGGYGLVSYEQGLSSAEQAAERAGVPAVSAFRVLDNELEGAQRIKRYLDRAAFAAAQEGQVLVIGHTYRETINALRDWVAAQEPGAYRFVPVSTLLLDSELSQ